jgi:hypothetical protein
VRGRQALIPLWQRKLILVTGKGGVGKSAATAAIAAENAARGRRTLALEVDPRENLHQLFDVPPSGGEIVEVEPRLYLQNLKPRDVVDWVVRRQVKIEMVVQRVLGSPVYHRFVEGAPGLKELAILGHALRLVRGDNPAAPKIDTVVLDAPATGHGLFLLAAPRLYAETIGHGPFAELAREVADFVGDPIACGVVVVTLAEEMPVQEALELRQGLREKKGADPDLLIVNGLYPPVPAAAALSPASSSSGELEGGTPSNSGSLGSPPSPSAERGAGGRGPNPDPVVEAMLELWRRRREVNERELAHLDEAWQGPKVELPLLPVDRGPLLLRSLSPIFHQAIEAAEAEA